MTNSTIFPQLISIFPRFYRPQIIGSLWWKIFPYNSLRCSNGTGSHHSSAKSFHDWFPFIDKILATVQFCEWTTINLCLCLTGIREFFQLRIVTEIFIKRRWKYAIAFNFNTNCKAKTARRFAKKNTEEN